MTTQTEFKVTAPPLRWDEAGGIRIGQSRVTIDSILASYHAGSTPGEIAVQYSVLTLAEIYATIAYYLTHRQQVDSYLKQRQQEAEERRQLLVKNNLTDENFNGAILHGLLRRSPDRDIILVHA